MGPVGGEITQLLACWAKGDQSALERLAPLVQSELRKIADAHLRRERPHRTLQPTALVNEAWRGRILAGLDHPNIARLLDGGTGIGAFRGCPLPFGQVCPQASVAVSSGGAVGVGRDGFGEARMVRV